MVKQREGEAEMRGGRNGMVPVEQNKQPSMPRSAAVPFK